MFLQIDQAASCPKGYIKSPHPIQPDSRLPCIEDMHVIKQKTNDCVLTNLLQKNS